LFEKYIKIAKQYKKPTLKCERKLIALAQKGDSSARDGLLFAQTGFFLFRIHKMLYPALIRRYGEDILQECFGFALSRVDRYKLRYKGKNGKPKPVFFRSYIWKGITGVVIKSIKNRREVRFSDLSYFYKRAI